jgi:threonine synthase
MPYRAAGPTATSFACASCPTEYSEVPGRWRCDCGGPLDLLNVPLPPEDLPKRLSEREWSWLRYREVLPIQATAAVRLGENCTPMVQLELDDREILVKQEQIASTGSFKDRGAFVLVSHAREIGIASLVEDSSGNAGAAIAAYCARAGIGCDIYVPDATGSAKTRQIETYGADVVRIDGHREDTAAAAMLVAEREWYGSHVWNPYFLHGTKLLAYEIWEQLGFKAPETLVLPAGNGTLLLGAYIGFSELLAAGLISAFPKIVGVQAARCCPVVCAFDGTPPRPAGAKTIASGIAVAKPARERQMVRAVRESGGSFVTVEDSDIEVAMAGIAAMGFYVEPTGVVGYAGTREYLRHHAGGSECIVTVFTGHGLKKAG